MSSRKVGFHMGTRLGLIDRVVYMSSTLLAGTISLGFALEGVKGAWWGEGGVVG